MPDGYPNKKGDCLRVEARLIVYQIEKENEMLRNRNFIVAWVEFVEGGNYARWTIYVFKFHAFHTSLPTQKALPRKDQSADRISELLQAMRH